MPTTRAPVFYELAEIAEMLGRGEMRIRQLIATGDIPAVKVGGRLRIPVAAFDEWIAHVNRVALASLDVDHERVAAHSDSNTQNPRAVRRTAH